MSMGEALANVTRTANDMAREIEALRKKLGDQRAYELRLREQHDLDVAEVNRLQVRVFELERPAVEAKRNEIRQSFMELAAAAREDRDYEGEAEVLLRLRDRETAWAAEDTHTPTPAPVESAGDETGEVERLRAKLAELTARARRVAVSHEHFIQDHSDPGTEALGAQYELINHLSRSDDPGDLPLNPTETALRLVLALLDETQDDASPIEIRRTIADALPRDDMSDNRRRLYVDGKGNAWISTCVEDGVEHVVPVQPAAWVDESIEEIAAENNGLREIGRCW